MDASKLSLHELGQLVNSLLAEPLSDRNRPIRLRLSPETGGLPANLLLAQRIDIHETVCHRGVRPRTSRRCRR